MKLSAALTKLKNLKSQLARVEKYIDASLTHDEDEEPSHNYTEQATLRSELVQQILQLKASIMQTNARTIVKHEDKMVSVNWLILKNAELRSELAYWTAKADTKPEEHRFSARTKDTIRKVLNKEFDVQAARAKIEELEQAKERLEATLAQANQTADVAD